jgi:ribosomal-protein-alanine N-acetyltransferase
MIEVKPLFPQSLTTERLLLSRLRADEFDEYLAFYLDKQATATLGGVKNADWVRQWLDRQLQHWEQHGFGWWTMRDRATGAFVGRGGLRYATIEGQDEVELGYGQFPQFWGQGLAAEMSREALHLGFDVLGLDSIVSFTLPTNLRSRRVMEKVGLRFEGDTVWADLPHVLYRLNRNDFQSTRSADT